MEEIMCEYYVKECDGEMTRVYGPIAPELLCTLDEYDLPVHVDSV